MHDVCLCASLHVLGDRGLLRVCPQVSGVIPWVCNVWDPVSVFFTWIYFVWHLDIAMSKHIVCLWNTVYVVLV